MGTPRAPLEELEREMRSGIPHYKTGQHRAYRAEEEPTLAVLVFVDLKGWATIMPCEREGTGGEWKASGVCMQSTATGLQTGWRELPECFTLGENLLEALAQCEVIPSSA